MVINLVIGLLGFGILDSFKQSFENKITSSSKQLLGADLSISARRRLTPDELKVADRLMPQSSRTKITTVYSMAQSKARSGLLELKAIEEAYPFYGEIRLKSEPSQSLQDAHLAWAVPEVLLQFDLSIGDSLKLGDISVEIAGEIEHDSSSSWAGAAYAPRIYISQKTLHKTGLVNGASTAWHQYSYQLAEGLDIDKIQKDLFSSLDHSIRIRTHLTAGQDNGRIVSYLNDYLGLVSLVALFLSGLGTYFLFRHYLGQKQREIAVLLCLGMRGVKASMIYTAQVFILGLAASCLVILTSYFFLPQLGLWIHHLSPVDLDPSITIEASLLILCLGTLFPLFLCLPLLLEISAIKASSLFQDYAKPQFRLSPRRLMGFIPLLVLSYALSIRQSHSFFVGSIFCLALLVATILALFFGTTIIKLTQQWCPKSVSTQLVLSYIQGQKLNALSCFVTLSLCSLLINLIPQVEKALLTELSQPKGSPLPSLFIFDIQETQKSELEVLLAKQDLITNFISPLVRARIVSINGNPFDKGSAEQSYSREAEREQRIRNRGVNLSYRAHLYPSESITDGRPFSGDFKGQLDDPGELSVETRYAQRLGLKLGDTMTFDIQGLPIKGRIVNFRKVHWNSFQPNFFIQFQPGVIDDAPKTYIAALPPLDIKEKTMIQKLIVTQFPNISMIDVTKLVQQLGSSIQQMALILKVMAWLSILSGLIVTLSIANLQAQTRIWDINLLKILGSSFKLIYQIAIKEFVMISSLATGLGAFTGLGFSWLLTSLLFDGLWNPDLMIPLQTSIAMIILSTGIGLAASYKTLQQKPQLYINN